MNREWIFHSLYNNFEIQQISPPRQRLANFRYENINQRYTDCKTVEDAREAIDSYGKWKENIGEKQRLGKIQVLLQAIWGEWLDIDPITLNNYHGAKEELLGILDSADTICYWRYGLTWNGEAWVSRKRGGRAITVPDPYITDLLDKLVKNNP